MGINYGKYFEFRGAIDRADFIWISLVLFLIHKYLLFVIQSNAITNVPYITALCYFIMVIVCYARFCAFAKRILDVTGEKQRNNFHNLAAAFMALSSFGLNNKFMLWVWIIVFAYCAIMPGKYTKR